LLSIPLPHLATFDIHARKIGQLAVRQLAMQIANRKSHHAESESQQIACQVLIKPSFIPGESVCELGNSKSNNGRPKN